MKRRFTIGIGIGIILMIIIFITVPMTVYINDKTVLYEPDYLIHDGFYQLKKIFIEKPAPLKLEHHYLINNRYVALRIKPTVHFTLSINSSQSALKKPKAKRMTTQIQQNQYVQLTLLETSFDLMEKPKSVESLDIQQKQQLAEDIVIVERVIDCSTLKLLDGGEVRLIGIECPEDKKMALEAMEFIRGTLKEGQELQFQFDMRERDEYGRFLVYVYIPASNPSGYHFADIPDEWVWDTKSFKDQDWDLMFLNATIIKAGYSEVAPDTDVGKHAELFEKLYQEAREQKRGLWK